MEHYNSVSTYFKNIFGEKVYKIALDGGMTCPVRDGTIDTRGCIFCSLGGSGEFAERKVTTIEKQLECAKARLKEKYKGHRFVAYFQSYTNTYAPIEYLTTLYNQVLEDEEIVGLSIGTRPDCITNETLKLLEECNQKKPIFVELGLQTIHTKTIQYIRRGYENSVYEWAMKELLKRGIHVVTHVIFGLPGETKEEMLETIRYVVKCKSSGIKIHCLYILKGTDICKDYQEGKFSILSEEDYLNLVCDAIELLTKDMIIHRLTGDPPKKDAVEPLWSFNKKAVLNHFNQLLEQRHITQGSKSST